MKMNRTIATIGGVSPPWSRLAGMAWAYSLGAHAARRKS